MGSIALETVRLQPLTHHMSTHILLMNVIAPLIAHGVAAGGQRLPAWLSTGASLCLATAAQLVTLWAVHIPVLLESVSGVAGGNRMVQGLLLVTALWFWTSALSQRGVMRWRALLALLVTGKLFCLLAALIVFAPRPLYELVEHTHRGATDSAPLADQQLAGLLMISTCPLTYVLEAIVISAIWLKELGARSAPAARAD
jgi:putative membrane protein